MVSFPDLSSLNSTSGIGGFMALPNASYPYYWAWILGGLWIILSLGLYFTEKEKIGRGNLLSSLAIATIPILIISTLGTIAQFISLEIMIYNLVFSFLIIGVWFFAGKN